MERRRGRPTSYDVARRAGVSQATVSRAFNPESPASDDVRKRVLAAAAEIGYAPNAMARSLNSGRSKIIGVLMHVVHIEGFPTVLVRLNHAIQTSGRQMLLFTIDAEEEADQALAHMLEYQVDGIISSATGFRGFLEQVRREGHRHRHLQSVHAGSAGVVRGCRPRDGSGAGRRAAVRGGPPKVRSNRRTQGEPSGPSSA